MRSKEVIQSELDFNQQALASLRRQYLALVDAGAKSYTIAERAKYNLELNDLSAEIEARQKKADGLTIELSGGKTRKAVGIVPMDW